MIAIAAVIAAATAVGFWVEHRYGEERAGRAAKVVIRVMLWVMLPPVAFVNLARLDPSTGVLAGLLFGLAGLGVALALAYAIGTRVLKLPRPAVGGLMLVSGFATTCYIGLPFTAARFGTDELPSAIVSELVLTSGSGRSRAGHATGSRCSSPATPRSGAASWGCWHRPRCRPTGRSTRRT